ncbi:MAG: cyclic nucleotide-binding domain-containing protein [Acidimicrobiales bacterium]|nr:cyclic nucleotide-binding domain-containing protein [Acidimicrobiales bacterium]
MFSLTDAPHWRPRRRRDTSPLADVPSLRDGDPRQLAELASHTDRLRLPPARTLVRAGELARQLIAVVSGEATAYLPDGRVAVLHAGDEIGGRELLHNERHRATVVTASDVEVVVVTGPAVRWAHQTGVADRHTTRAVRTARVATRPTEGILSHLLRRA